MKRILHVVPSLTRGGTEAFIMNNYLHLDREKMQFDFLSFYQDSYPLVGEIESLGGQVSYIRHPSLAHIYGFYKDMKRAIKKGGPYDTMHCHVNTGNAVPLLCGALCGIKIRISHSHAVTEPGRTLPAKLVTLVRKGMIRLFANKFLACSNIAGETLYGKKFFQNHGTVCRNGIDVDRFCTEDKEKTTQLLQEFSIPTDHDIILGNITRFDLNKNQTFIVDVFAELRKSRPKAILLLGGSDGGQLAPLQEKVKGLGIEENVRFIGMRDDIAGCLQLIDVFVFPSFHEGLGIAMLEAQAADCLCVASTGVPDANLEIGNGFLLDLSLGAAAWSAFIEEQLCNKKPIPDAQIKKVFQEKGFDIEQSAMEMISIYAGK